MMKTEEHKQKQEHKKKKKQGPFLSNFHEESLRHERKEREAQGKKNFLLLSFKCLCQRQAHFHVAYEVASCKRIIT